MLKNVKQRKLEIDSYISSIYDHLRGKPYHRHVYGVIPISNRKAKDPGIERLRQVIVEVATKQSHWGEQRPNRWLLLADKLSQEGDKRLEEPVIQLDEVIRFAAQVGVQESEVAAFLDFHHKLGDFIHFNETGMKDTIILCPQWLANVFRYVSTNNYRVKVYFSQCDHLNTIRIILISSKHCSHKNTDV